MSGRAKELLRRLADFRYALIVAAVGLVLMLWPSGAAKTEDSGGQTGEEAHLAAVLRQIEGVGRTQVLLSDSGAVVVCEGADVPSVRLSVTQAVRCYTGLGANEVTILKIEE